MNELKCFGCVNKLKDQQKVNLHSNDKVSFEQLEQSGEKHLQNLQKHSKVTFQLQHSSSQNQTDSVVFFRCECCNHIYCQRCCITHIENESSQPEIKHNSPQKNQTKIQENDPIKLINQQKKKRTVHIVCQQCEDQSSIKYCGNCQQFLCEQCSFKIHNKGKRAKHILDQNVNGLLTVRFVIFLNKDIFSYLKELYSNNVCQRNQDILLQFLKDQLKITANCYFLMIQESLRKQFENIDSNKFMTQIFDPQSFKYEDLFVYCSKYPFLTNAKLVITSKDTIYHLTLADQAEAAIKKPIILEQHLEYKKKIELVKHERVHSQKFEIKHNKNISNFSNVSAISKVQNQSVISNQPSDLFEPNQLSLNITLNQNSSILMIGALSDRDKQDKEQKKIQAKQNDKQSALGHHRIYSIREQNSHASANNLSTSTQNSIRKRNKKWPIPYFQPFRIPKHERDERGDKYNAELFLRDLAEKGILMIRRQKAEEYLLDPQISRNFVRNIGEKQIEYVAYIIDFLSIECLTWVIESIKEDKMTPNQKLIQSRLKQSFDLKVNMKLWQSIIKYIQSTQYEQDYFQNTKIRYVPKISIVKYGQQYLLQFQERKWAYEDQDLLDEQEQEWQQFKKLIADYFNGKSQITGGRYGCVQYVKLNGPKPLRKCSLGKLSMYVQQAINKGIIRYHKTLLVSNSQHNNSTCSNLNAGIDNLQQLAQLQKDIKIMSIQMALIDMFLEVAPLTPISLAQIPLNLKKGIIFQYNLVELGFPKLKNILNTLNDKLILETTKTHITYEITTNGSEAIQKMRNKLLEASQKYLSHILSFISIIMMNYQSITLEELYNQLSYKLGFAFDFKIYKTPDFYQFTLYYCTQIISVQYLSGMFFVYPKYLQYPTYETHQTHRSTYSQDQYSSYGLGYSSPQEDYSRTAQKKYSQQIPEQQPKYPPLRVPSMGSEEFEMIGVAITTPRFSNGTCETQKKGFDALVWEQCYEDTLKKDDKINQYEYDQDEQSSKQMQHIMNLLDDDPNTVIVKDGSQINNNHNNQFYLLPKNTCCAADQFSVEDVAWGQDGQMETKSGKSQHIRVKSTNQPATKHWRGYSTTIERK